MIFFNHYFCNCATQLGLEATGLLTDDGKKKATRGRSASKQELFMFVLSNWGGEILNLTLPSLDS